MMCVSSLTVVYCDFQVTRKIMREVKLLSRLHHDNVVRYYTSWIETVDKPESGGEDSSYSDSEPSDEDTSISIKKKSKKGSAVDRLRQRASNRRSSSPLDPLPPSVASGGGLDQSHASDLSFSFLGVSSGGVPGDSESSDDLSEDDDIFGTSFLPANSLYQVCP